MPIAGRLYVTLWGGPADGKQVRIYDSTEEIHVGAETGRTERYVRQPDGTFKYAGPVTKGTDT